MLISVDTAKPVTKIPHLRDYLAWRNRLTDAAQSHGGRIQFTSEGLTYFRGGLSKAIDYLNWNAKGGNDLLVQVFGHTDAWYEALSADSNHGWKKGVGGGRPAGRDFRLHGPTTGTSRSTPCWTAYGADRGTGVTGRLRLASSRLSK